MSFLFAEEHDDNGVCIYFSLFACSDVIYIQAL